jgi:hypothetical protein
MIKKFAVNRRIPCKKRKIKLVYIRNSPVSAVDVVLSRGQD